MKNLFAAAIFGKYNGPILDVEFWDGRPAATYPGSALDMLKAEPAIRWICDSETGEILHTGKKDPRRGVYWIVAVHPDTVHAIPTDAASMDAAKTTALFMLYSIDARPESLYIAKLPALYNGQPDTRIEPSEELTII